MQEPAFKLEASFDDKTGRVAAVYLRIRDGKVAETLELEDGVAYADYGANHLLLGIELLGPCQIQILDKIAQHEPEPVRRFLMGGAPREMVLA